MEFTRIFTGKATAVRPTAKEIAAIEIGCNAPSAFGDNRKVTRITARDRDVNGKLFICYYTEFGPNSEMSNSLKEGEVLRTVALSNAHTSAEIRSFDLA